MKKRIISSVVSLVTLSLSLTAMLPTNYQISVNASVINNDYPQFSDFDVEKANTVTAVKDENADFILYKDELGLIFNDTFGLSNDEYALLLNDKKYVAYYLHKSRPCFSIHIDDYEKCDEIISMFNDFVKRENLTFDDFHIGKQSAYTSGKVQIGSDLLDIKTAEKFCNELSESEIINSIFSMSFSGEFYTASETEILHRYILSSHEEIDALHSLLIENGYDIDDFEESFNVNIDDTDIPNREYCCWFKTAEPMSSLQIIELCELIHKELGFVPEHIDYASVNATESESSVLYYKNRIVGDVTGDEKTDVSDLSMISLMLIGDKTLSHDQQRAADVNKDEKVSLSDLATLKQFISKQIDSL